MACVSANYLNGQSNPWGLSGRQAILTGVAGAGSAFLGAFVVGSLVKSGYSLEQIDDVVLDTTLTIAGGMGVGAAELFDRGADEAGKAVDRIGNNYTNQINNQ